LLFLRLCRVVSLSCLLYPWSSHFLGNSNILVIVGSIFTLKLNYFWDLLLSSLLLLLDDLSWCSYNLLLLHLVCLISWFCLSFALASVVVWHSECVHHFVILFPLLLSFLWNRVVYLSIFKHFLLLVLLLYFLLSHRSYLLLLLKFLHIYTFLVLHLESILGIFFVLMHNSCFVVSLFLSLVSCTEFTIPSNSFFLSMFLIGVQMLWANMISHGLVWLLLLYWAAYLDFLSLWVFFLSCLCFL